MINKPCNVCNKKMKIYARQTHKKVCAKCSGKLKTARALATYHTKAKNKTSRAKYWIERRRYLEAKLEGGDAT